MSRRSLRAQVELALLDAMGGVARSFLWVRGAGALILLPTLAALVWGERPPWRPWLVGAGELAVLLSAASEVGRAGPPSGRRLQSYVALILSLHTVVIATTGGVESPFLPVYIPVTVMLAVAVGRRRAFAWNVAVLAIPVVALWALRIWGAPVGVPATLRLGPAGPPDALYLGLQAGFVILFMGAGGFIGLRLRAALDAATLEVTAARAETLAAVQAQSRELATLSSTLAHELKNPLAAIQSLSGLVARKLPEGGREAEHMSVLRGEVTRLGGILDEFLNLSRPADGLNASPTDPAELVAAVARLYSAEGRLTVALSPCGPVRCDPRKLRQVLINLVENALQHGPPEGAVRLSLDAHEGAARLRVEDEGPGPTAEALARAFEAGFTTRPEGTGLGLTVARAIARQHGGALSLERRDGGGARATLRLPLEDP